jgi:hypothetical protein
MWLVRIVFRLLMSDQFSIEFLMKNAMVLPGLKPGIITRRRWIMTCLPIADVVRPRGNRDDCGAKGEILHQFADMLEKYFPNVRVQRGMSKEDLFPLVSGLMVPKEHVLLKRNSLRILPVPLVPIEEIEVTRRGS